ncbi:hypothetical protein BKA70DRAFT_1471172 [Coprinopsis sp. MPI-PUGE-AT-0042]|nr:hypothetical protein BKA70DRAFT_1471172 [Coprinopsis sp. MPI-PUGE-AT-0042]
MPRAPRKRQAAKSSSASVLQQSLPPSSPSSLAPSLLVPPSPPPARPDLQSLEALYPHSTREGRQQTTAAEQARVHRAIYGPAPLTKCTNKQRREWKRLVVAELQAHPYEFARWIGSGDPTGDSGVAGLLQPLFDSLPGVLPPVKRSDCVSWLLDIIDGHPSLHSALHDANKERRRRRELMQRYKRFAGAAYVVFKTPQAYAQHHITVLRLFVSALPQGHQYPPLGHWVAETRAIFDQCHPFLRGQRLADARGNRYPVHLLEAGRLVHTIPENLTCLIYDANTKQLIASVVRNFSQSPTLLEWVGETIQEAVDTRKSVRTLEVLCSLDTSAADIRNAAASAFFWKHVQMLHPLEVANDIESFYRKYDIPRLDSNWPESNALRGVVVLPSLDGGELEFRDIEFGPGCLVMSQRYSRPVHFEFQPHQWAVSWTTLRSGTNVSGNNFFLANYGIRINQATDTSIAWRPSQCHTSSLGSWDPVIAWARGDDPTFNQQGMAFVTSNRIAPVYAMFAAMMGLTGQERVEGAIADLEGDWANPETTAV